MTVKKTRPIPKFEPSVLVVSEKHGTTYYYLPDREALGRAALDIVSDRLESEWGQFYFDPTDQKPKDPGMTEEEVAALPGPMKAAGEKLLKRYKEELHQWQKAMALYTDIVAAVEKEDGSLAWDILTRRSHYEYESVRIEKLTIV